LASPARSERAVDFLFTSPGTKPLLHFTEFVTASIAVIALPGPGQIAILTATLSGGFKAGLKAVAGLVTGDIAIMTLVALGIATILGMYPGITRAIRIAGGLYIVWIGVDVFTSRLGTLVAAPRMDGAPRWYARTVGITLMNPKAVLFFLSFFPLFMDPSLGVTRSFLQMGTLFTLLSGSYLVFFAWSGAKLADRLQRSPAAGIWIPRLLGTVILVFGARMLVA